MGAGYPLNAATDAEHLSLRDFFAAVIPALERLASSRAVVLDAAQAAIDHERTVDGWVDEMRAAADAGG